MSMRTSSLRGYFLYLYKTWGLESVHLALPTQPSPTFSTAALLWMQPQIPAVGPHHEYPSYPFPCARWGSTKHDLPEDCNSIDSYPCKF